MTDHRPPSGRPRLARYLRPGLAGLAVVVLAAAPACGDDEADDAGTDVTTTTEPPATTSTTAPPTPEEEAEAVYLELVDVVERLTSTEPDPDDEDLNRLATEPVLGEIRDNFATMLAENHRVEIGSRTSHRVMSVEAEEADTAILRECYVGNDTTTDLDDGSIVDQGLATRVLEATVTRSGGAWAVSDVATIDILDGEVPCPE
jgi:hypothetical protein